MYVENRIGLLLRLYPERAAAKVRVGLQISGGNVAATAARFGVTPATLHRWISRLGLQARLTEIRRAKGVLTVDQS